MYRDFETVKKKLAVMYYIWFENSRPPLKFLNLTW